MDIERAKEINRACVNCSLGSMGFEEHEGDRLPNCSLADMLEAARIMTGYKELNEDGTATMYVHVADRWLAARYAFEQYSDSPERLLEALGFELTTDD